MTMLSLLAITTTAPNYAFGALVLIVGGILFFGVLILAAFILGPVEGGQP